MHIYKYRVTLEEQEDFLREIEIKSNQTFEDLHKAIQKAIDFDGSQLASFYICDSNWRKQKEITLLDMTDMDDKEQSNGMLLMKDAKLKDYTEDPHQKIIYVYDFLNMYTFLIELYKISPASPDISYPRCSKSTGNMPKNNQHTGIPLNGVSDDDEFGEFKDSYEDSESQEDDLFEESSEEEGYLNDSQELGDGFEELKF